MHESNAGVAVRLVVILHVSRIRTNKYVAVKATCLVKIHWL